MFGDSGGGERLGLGVEGVGDEDLFALEFEYFLVFVHFYILILNNKYKYLIAIQCK